MFSNIIKRASNKISNSYLFQKDTNKLVYALASQFGTYAYKFLEQDGTKKIFRQLISGGFNLTEKEAEALINSLITLSSTSNHEIQIFNLYYNDQTMNIEINDYLRYTYNNVPQQTDEVMQDDGNPIYYDYRNGMFVHGNLIQYHISIRAFEDLTFTEVSDGNYGTSIKDLNEVVRIQILLQFEGSRPLIPEDYLKEPSKPTTTFQKINSYIDCTVLHDQCYNISRLGRFRYEIDKTHQFYRQCTFTDSPGEIDSITGKNYNIRGSAVHIFIYSSKGSDTYCKFDVRTSFLYTEANS